jgi:anhydro-N-acetylmuramic acid kinase
MSGQAPSTVQLACGLMSGTSCDAVDAALVWTDGYDYIKLGPTSEVPISTSLRNKIRTVQTWADTTHRSSCVATQQSSSNVFISSQAHTQRNVHPDRRHPFAIQIEEELTALHALAVQLAVAQLSQEELQRTPLRVVGFHGNTICHFPPSRQMATLNHHSPFTWQLGDGQRLANLLQVPVVFRFRDNDIAQGKGEGAPLAPIYHRALCTSRMKPRVNPTGSGHPAIEMAVLNIGGVSNITICTTGHPDRHTTNTMLAFDIGPGNALLDDFMLARTGIPMDNNGAAAAKGTPNTTFIQRAMTAGPLSAFLTRQGPKSCDRDQFVKSLDQATLSNMSTNDGAATLTMLTVQCIRNALSKVPLWTQTWSHPLSSSPQMLVVAGGGRKNATLIRWLSNELGSKVHVVTADAVGWRGDSVEAEAFAYLAVRSVLRLPLSWPGTTGTIQPVTGGILVHPRKDRTAKDMDDGAGTAGMLPWVVGAGAGGILVVLLVGFSLWKKR